MKKASIKLNDSVSVDIDELIQGGMVILANSGGGKSYAIRRIAEQAVPNIQVIILDPEGEFSSLREKFDFILAGKDADVPVEVRSASMLAIKLLELEKSCVIDLYELHPQERQRYVKLFCEAIVNCPKDLYHPVLIILDEAHEYVPEGKPSEATWAVELLASKGRKRGQRLILASQRIAKISKNVTAEANNKLIGRASQDIDMKRAGDELGFTKERLFDLRQLKPGEFYVFGNAISNEVQKIKIGDVKTTHAKVGYSAGEKKPAPSAVIKKVLAELKDLPQEAEKELKMTVELKQALSIARREITELKKSQTKVVHDMTVPQRMIDKAVADAEKQYKKVVGKIYQNLLRTHGDIERALKNMGLSLIEIKKVLDLPEKKFFQAGPISPEMMKNVVSGSVITFQPFPKDIRPIRRIEFFKTPEELDDSILGKGELVILKAIAQYPDGISPEHIAVLTGYKATSRRTYLQNLRAKGYVGINSNGEYKVTENGLAALGNDHEPLPTGDALREYLIRTLPEGEKRILEILIEAYPEAVYFPQIEEKANYKPTSRRTYLQKLSARKLVIVGKDGATASNKLFD